MLRTNSNNFAVELKNGMPQARAARSPPGPKTPRRMTNINSIHRQQPRPSALLSSLWMVQADAAGTHNNDNNDNISSEENGVDSFSAQTTTTNSNGEDTASTVTIDNKVSPSWKTKFVNYIKGGSDDGLTFKQRLAKMGLATMLSYGWVSNMSYSVTVSVAWYIFSKQVRTRLFYSLSFTRSLTKTFLCPLTLVYLYMYVPLDKCWCKNKKLAKNRRVSVPLHRVSGRVSWLSMLVFGSLITLSDPSEWPCRWRSVQSLTLLWMGSKVDYKYHEPQPSLLRLSLPIWLEQHFSCVLALPLPLSWPVSPSFLLKYRES